MPAACALISEACFEIKLKTIICLRLQRNGAQKVNAAVAQRPSTAQAKSSHCVYKQKLRPSLH